MDRMFINGSPKSQFCSRVFLKIIIFDSSVLGKKDLLVGGKNTELPHSFLDDQSRLSNTPPKGVVSFKDGSDGPINSIEKVFRLGSG